MEEQKRLFYKKKAIEIFNKSKIYFKQTEFDKMEITDFGLGDFENIGLNVIIYVNTARVCAKELALLPYQICPQHRHPDIDSSLGKEETFRCRWGEVYLYVDTGEKETDFKDIKDKIPEIRAKIPEKYKDKLFILKEIILKPGDQYTLEPNTWHWFQGGPKGAVLSEFSSHSFDAGDIFYDKNIRRVAVDN